MATLANDSSKKALILGTVAFSISFALWGLLSGLMPILKAQLSLSSVQASLLVAIPVVLGSLGRIPIGIASDRFGGKKVFLFVMTAAILPVIGLGFARDYTSFLFLAALLGVAGTSFAVGVTFVSRWYANQNQGTILGIYGVGNIGQSIAVFGAPALAAAVGLSWAVWTFAAAAAIYVVVFALKARDAEWRLPPKKFSEIARLFIKEDMCWVLSLLYFQTFGGFVALSIYMPMLLKEIFSLPPADAGFRTAVFVVIATLSRPLGGWLSDQFGSKRVLSFALLGIVICGLLMTSKDLGYFTVSALGAAICVGLGNGGVFKLVPQFFPKDVGTVTGLVGAAGGMGGFFPPLVLGYCKDHFAAYDPGFLCLAGFATICMIVLHLRLGRGAESSSIADMAKAT